MTVFGLHYGWALMKILLIWKAFKTWVERCDWKALRIFHSSRKINTARSLLVVKLSQIPHPLYGLHTVLSGGYISEQGSIADAVFFVSLATSKRPKRPKRPVTIVAGRITSFPRLTFQTWKERLKEPWCAISMYKQVEISHPPRVSFCPLQPFFPLSVFCPCSSWAWEAKMISRTRYENLALPS